MKQENIYPNLDSYRNSISPNSKLKMTLLNQSPEKNKNIQITAKNNVEIKTEESDSEFEDEYLKNASLNKFESQNSDGSDQSEGSSVEEIEPDYEIDHIKVPKKVCRKISGSSRRSSTLSQQSLHNNSFRDEIKVFQNLEDINEINNELIPDSLTQTKVCSRKSISAYRHENFISHQQKIVTKGKFSNCLNYLFNLQSWVTLSFIFMILFGLGLIAISIDPSNKSITNNNSLTNDASSKSKANQKFLSYIDLLKSKYPQQTNLFWANIKSSYQHSILRAKDPSIILIVNDKETRNLASDLAYDILNSVKASIEEQTHNLNDLIISPKTDSELKHLIEQKKSNKIKLHIDTKLNKLFFHGQKIALVKNIEVVPATSMLLFYTYGDDIHSAKYPGIVILMTLEIDDTMDNKKELLQSQSKLTGYIESYLFSLWSKEVGEDQLRPLFTRIANNVIIVNTEFGNEL